MRKVLFLGWVFVLGALVSCGDGGVGTVNSGTAVPDLSVISTGPHPAFPDGFQELQTTTWEFEFSAVKETYSLYPGAEFIAHILSSNPVAQDPHAEDLSPVVHKLSETWIEQGYAYEDQASVTVNKLGAQMIVQPKWYDELSGPPEIVWNGETVGEYLVQKGEQEIFPITVDLEVKEDEISGEAVLNFFDFAGETIPEGVIWDGEVFFFDENGSALLSGTSAEDFEKIKALTIVFHEENTLATQFPITFRQENNGDVPGSGPGFGF